MSVHHTAQPEFAMRCNCNCGGCFPVRTRVHFTQQMRVCITSTPVFPCTHLTAVSSVSGTTNRPCHPPYRRGNGRVRAAPRHLPSWHRPQDHRVSPRPTNSRARARLQAQGVILVSARVSCVRVGAVVGSTGWAASVDLADHLFLAASSK